MFYQYEDIVPPSRNLKFMGYQNTHIVVIGAREGRATLTQELGITVENEDESSTIDRMKWKN